MAVLINLFPNRIRSSSPKLNFFIKIPVPMAVAAAGVESTFMYELIFSKALEIFDTRVG